MPRLVGHTKAYELMLTGRTIDAEEALRCGLINGIVEGNNLLEEALILMQTVAKQAPLAVARVLKAVQAYSPTYAPQGYDEEARLFAQGAHDQDVKEGIAAFLGKRKPNFKGV